MNRTPTNIIIADDHQMIIDGIKSMLETEKDFNIVNEAANGQEAIDIINSFPDNIDILITDISMPLLSGIDLCKIVKHQYPDIKVLMLSMYNSIPMIKESVSAEADGYILKNAGKSDLLTALHKIVNDGVYYSEEVLPIIYNQIQKEKNQIEEISVLTEREKEILQLIVKEYSSKEIADKLFISKKTVDKHRENILQKTQSKSTIGLVKFALKNGLE